MADQAAPEQAWPVTWQGLEAAGYSLRGYPHNQRSESFIGKHEPEFAIVDIRLAHDDLGTDVAAELRRTTKPAIIFSAGNSSDLFSIALLGDAVMTKSC